MGAAIMGRSKKVIATLATAVLAAATVLWMQHRFESTDKRNAVELVQGYRSPSGKTIPELISHHHPDKDVQWSSRARSACLHHIYVQGNVAGDASAAPTSYLFVVNINGPSIHPGNETGRRLLGELNQPAPTAPSASASASATTP